MRYLRLMAVFLRISFEEDAAYPANFFISVFHSLLNLMVGVVGLWVLFGQIESVHGWNLASTLALLGVYLTVSSLRSLFIGAGLESLAGMDGEIWKGTFDFTLVRPLNTQFLVSVRKWRLFALFDLFLGGCVLAAALWRLDAPLMPVQALAFMLALGAGLVILYSILLIFAALVFWSPEVLFTWIFDSFFSLARYPLGMYPGWLRLVLTWVIPVGVITTFPAEALTGSLSGWSLAGCWGAALLLAVGSSALFRLGLGRYRSASS
jgi:ABC-2 type transport system permease protein